MNPAFRKLHRKVAPILFIPLLLSAVTGIAFRLGNSWFNMPPQLGGILISIHQGAYLGNALSSVYVLLVGLGLLGLIITGLSLLGWFGRRPARSRRSTVDNRRIHRIIAPLIFLPLIISAVTGMIYRIGEGWFGLPVEQIGIFLRIHQGTYLGDTLRPIYVLLVGLGLLAMLITGIKMTGIFRRRHS